MEVIVKLNSQTAGRDKLVRLLQYTSKFAWHYMQEKQRSKQSVDRLKDLEYTFSSFRKLLRLGRCLDVLYGALSSVQYPDLTLRITCTLSRIANALYLLADHILWFGRTGMLNINSAKWNQVANKYWLYSIVMNLVRDVYEILQIVKYETHNCIGLKRMGSPDYYRKPATDKLSLIKFVQEHKDVVIDTVKNGCDFFIPMSALGYIRLNPGTVGVLGVISSVAAIISLVDPFARLSPA
ncbi:peroxisomal membrane protein 11B [Schistocerca gregaria]|uniref:peroxisomal membrane protein 11B n=1 Tax=Schistocerca gregaria TaxID=7010 RepID=UPI00211E2273|nr:peroxisomal membrane protein 11B [Schistocerca gregaria]